MDKMSGMRIDNINFLKDVSNLTLTSNEINILLRNNEESELLIKQKNLICYDFGCGYNKCKGFIGIDNNYDIPNLDYIYDFDNDNLEGIIDKKADFVACFHVIEHLKEKTINRMMHSLSKILKPGGIFVFVYPHISCDSAYIPDHLHVITKEYFINVFKKWKELFPNDTIVFDELMVYSKTPYLKLLMNKLNMEEEDVLNIFRNVATEYLLIGYNNK